MRCFRCPTGRALHRSHRARALRRRFRLHYYYKAWPQPPRPRRAWAMRCFLCPTARSLPCLRRARAMRRRFRLHYYYTAWPWPPRRRTARALRRYRRPTGRAPVRSPAPARPPRAWASRPPLPRARARRSPARRPQPPVRRPAAAGQTPASAPDSAGIPHNSSSCSLSSPAYTLRRPALPGQTHLIHPRFCGANPSLRAAGARYSPRRNGKCRRAPGAAGCGFPRRRGLRRHANRLLLFTTGGCPVDGLMCRRSGGGMPLPSCAAHGRTVRARQH